MFLFFLYSAAARVLLLTQRKGRKGGKKKKPISISFGKAKKYIYIFWAIIAAAT